MAFAGGIVAIGRGDILEVFASALRVHRMKLSPWTERLVVGTVELRRAREPREIVDGIEDVSFWIGRLVCDAFGAIGEDRAADSDLERAGAAMIDGQKAIVQAKRRLWGSDVG